VHITSPKVDAAVHPLSPSDPPRVQFTSDSRFGASDGVNYLSGTFTTTATGFSPGSDTTSTAAGYAGKDPIQLAIQDGIAKLTEGPNSIDVAVSTGTTPITATMTIDGYVLTFDRGATAHPDAPPSSTGSS